MALVRISQIILLVVLLAFGKQDTFAQYAVQFLNASNAKAIADLSVHLSYLPKDKKPVYAFYVSDMNGLVQLKESGYYFLQINFPGYKTVQDTVLITNAKKPLVYLLQENELVLGEAVITGESELKSADQALNRVRIIDRKRIERQGAVNLKDLLSNELNIRLSNDNFLGSSLSLQGVSGQNIKILIDGVPIIGRMDGNLDLTQINLNNIERVEIVEGPMSVMYGTDALGGVINLITKKSTSHTLEANTQSYYESNGTYNFDGKFGVRKKKGFIQTTLGRNFFEGVASDGDLRSRTWKPREQYFADINLGYQGKKATHRIQASWFEEKLTARGEPVIQPYRIYGVDQYFFTQRNNISLHSDFKLSSKSSLNFINSYSVFNRIKNSYIKDLVTLEQRIMSDITQQDTANFDLLLFRGIYTNNALNRFKYQLGYDVNIETGSGERLAGDIQTIGDYAAFASLEWLPLSKLSVKPAFRASHNTRYGSPIIPSLHFKYSFNQNFQTRFSYARGFRAPGLKELSLYFVDASHDIQGNGNLQAELSDNFNASLTYKRRLNNKWSAKIDGAAFYNEIRNMISLSFVRLPNVYTYQNIDRFKSQGFNITADLRSDAIGMSLGYALIGRSNLQWTDNDLFTYSPELRFTSNYIIPVIKTDIAIFYKFTGITPGSANGENNELVQTSIGSFTTMDVTLTKSFLKKFIFLTAGAKNVFDVTNINFSGAGGGGAHSGTGGGMMPVNMGRAYFVSLRLNFIQFK